MTTISSRPTMARSCILVTTALLASKALAQSCISLSGSTQCSAFNQSSISTNGALVGLYPFLASVTDVQSFDQGLSQYVSGGYVETKYVNLFGCDNVNLGNTTEYYARYTTSFLCNGIVQNSRDPCGVTNDNLMPLCAESCAQLALSEQQIIGNTELCSGRNDDYENQLRADFTNCALPANSLSGTCIQGELNEPDNCGFGSSLTGLCNFCRASTENGTDSCCLTSNAEGRCQDVTLPVFSSLTNSFSMTATSTGSSSTTPTAPSISTQPAGSGAGGSGLSGGAIAGIVIGSIVGFLLLLGLLVFCCIFMRRRRRDSKSGSLLNQPTPPRKGVTSSYQAPASSHGPGYEVLPGGRVARMSALQGNEAQRDISGTDSDPYGGTPESNEKAMAFVTARKGGSPLGHSQKSSSSPDSNDYSSPEGVASGQSEQLPFFKDYYSNDDIHPGDRVSVLWAYQPRAGDEFELERGDMLKVVGIWDDGWATGVLVNDRAEDYDGKHKAQRDSGVSNGSVHRDESPTPEGDIKAFPLVCVCLPEAWKKTVEGDTSTEGSGGMPGP